MHWSLSYWPSPVSDCVWLRLQCCTEYLAALLRCCETVVMGGAQWLDSLVHHSLCTEPWKLLVGHSTPHTASLNWMQYLTVETQLLQMEQNVSWVRRLSHSIMLKFWTWDRGWIFLKCKHFSQTGVWVCVCEMVCVCTWCLCMYACACIACTCCAHVSTVCPCVCAIKQTL